LLPQDTGYALIPFTTETNVVAWTEHARLARENRQNIERELAMLSEKLTERKYIERAKGMLMKLHQLDEKSAYNALRSAAMNNSTSIGQVAKNLIATLEVVGEASTSLGL
jgi:response regulator NasT